MQRGDAENRSHNPVGRSPGFYKNLYEDFQEDFFWPSTYNQVKDYCKTFPAERAAAPVPLMPLPVISAPFECIGVDVVGPAERRQEGQKFISVICDCATRYPEACPLREVTAKRASEALLKLFSQVGIPKEMLTHQGPNFMSRRLTQVYKILGMRRVIKHPLSPSHKWLG